MFSMSKPLSGPAGSHIGPTGNPIDGRKDKGFVQLQGDNYAPGTSNEGLFDGIEGAKNHTVQFFGHHDLERGEEDPDLGIPLRQIHVRGDVHVVAQSR